MGYLLIVLLFLGMCCFSGVLAQLLLSVFVLSLLLFLLVPLLHKLLLLLWMIVFLWRVLSLVFRVNSQEGPLDGLCMINKDIPVVIPNQSVAVSHYPQEMFGSGQCHIHPPEVIEESQLSGGSHTGQHYDILLPPLICIHCVYFNDGCCFTFASQILIH